MINAPLSTDLGTSSNRTQQLGCISHGGCTVDEGGGELGCLTEVMFLVPRRFVHNTCITYKTTSDYYLLNTDTILTKAFMKLKLLFTRDQSTLWDI